MFGGYSFFCCCFAVLLWQKSLMVSVLNGRSLGKKCCFSSCSKAERKKLGITFTIILCVPLAFTDLVLEQRRRMQQVAR